MVCNMMLPSINMEWFRENEIKIQETTISISKKVKNAGKQIIMIQKQHKINVIAFAGNGWFAPNGMIYDNIVGVKPEHCFKYKIEYSNKINREEHVWCFN